jgi:hypothetical protein
VPPATSEDDRAILLGFLLVHSRIRYYRFQMPRVSAFAPTFGSVQ